MSNHESSESLQPAGQPDMTLVLNSIRASLEQTHGPLLKGDGLANALGYKTMAALRQAKKRNQVGVPLFELPNRKGLYALTAEVADWLAKCRLEVTSNSAASNEESAMP